MIELTEKDIQRFWAYVEKGDSCWMWTGSPGTAYGIFTVCRSGKDVAEMFGVSRSNIGEIVARRTWKHVA